MNHHLNEYCAEQTPISQGNLHSLENNRICKENHFLYHVKIKLTVSSNPSMDRIAMVVSLYLYFLHTRVGLTLKFYLFKQISGFLCEVGRQVEFTLENLVNCFLSVLPSERRLESTIVMGGKIGLVQVSNLCT